MSRMRWGDTLDDEEEEHIPETEVKGPDKDGIKVIIDYYRNNKGQIIKRTRKIKVIKVEKTIYKAAEERRRLVKFGDADTEDNAAATMQVVEDIYFERTNIPKQTQVQNKNNADIKALMSLGSNSAVNQGLTDLLQQKRRERESKPAAIPEEEPVEEPISKGGYVAPHRRANATASSMDPKRRDENSVRVTNLSEQVTEEDLRELFRRFGQIGRVYVAKDKTTGVSRGFAFVNFVRREDAQNAIATLDGYGYDNLIMSVSWAQPRQ